MAFVVIEIDAPIQSIVNLNAKLQRPTKPHDGIREVSNFLNAILAGSVDASVQVTTRDVTAGIGTSGANSQQELYNLK